MPINTEVQSRIDLLVGIDKSTYREAKKTLESLFDKRVEIGVDEGALKGLADKFRDASRSGGDDISAALSQRFDSQIGVLLNQFENIREQVQAAFAANDHREYALLMDKQALLEAEISASMDAHKKRIDAAKKYKEATALNLQNMRAAGGAVEEGFVDALNKARSGDLAGFTQSIFGSMSKAFGKASENKMLAAAGADTAAMGSSLEAAAVSLGTAAAALASIAAVAAVAVAAFAVLDDAAKDLNKSLLEGAGIADFSAQSQVSALRDVEGSMEAARKASIDMAFEFRGTSEEMSGILAQLNQAGFSYKEMEEGATTVADKQAKYAEAVRETFVWSKALGASTSEIADTTAEWSTTFGHGLEKIGDDFGVIAEFAQQGGFNVKRFFTSVSQATAGMALYNVRMEEAAFLLAKTQKILGGTDAADFVKSLTQGFTDESTTDRLKRIMIAGAKDTDRIFKDTAARTAKGFVDAFAGSDTADKISAAFKSVNTDFDVKVLSDPKMLQDTWGKMDAKSRRLVIAELRANGDEQSQAAARQLETLGRVVDGATKGQAAQVRGLGALDMQGKLAYKLQTLGDKRLNDMGVEELAAFESYAGISGSQLEQLMRVESQLMADYELAKKNGETTARSFDEFVSSNDEAQKQLKEIGDIQSQADYFAQQNVENTRSVFSVLKNTIAMILENIYDLLTSWFGASKKLDSDDQAKLVAAITGLGEERKASTARLDEIDRKISDADKVIQTTGDTAPEHVKAVADKQALATQRKAEIGTQEYLRAQERHIRLMDKDKLESTDDVASLARKEMNVSGEDVEILSRYVSPELVSDVNETLQSIATFDMRKAAGDEHALATHGMPADGRDVVAETLRNTAGASDAIAQEGNKLFTQFAFSGGKGVADLTAEEKKVLEDHVRSFPTTMTDAVADGTRKANAEKLATSIGYEKNTADFDRYVSDIMTGNWSKLKYGLETKGLEGQVRADFGVDLAKVSSPNVGQDFVMRPGQPAQRFNPSDTILGMKGGGPLVTGQQGGGVVNITINGGNQAEIYNTVKSALKNAGLR